MYGFVAKLLMSKQLEFGQGHIKLLEQPICILPSTFVEILMKQSMISREEMLRNYLEAWKAGYIFMYNVVSRYKLNTPDERYRVAMDTISLSGMGDYKTEEFIPFSHTRFTVIENPLALRFHPSDSPVDHVLRGFNAGGGTPVHARIMNCVELECAAVNGKQCRFVNASIDILKTLPEDIVKSQLDVDFLIREEQKFLESFGHNVPV